MPCSQTLDETLEKLSLRALRGRHRHYSSQARFGLNGDKRGKMQSVGNRKEGREGAKGKSLSEH